MRSVVVMLTGKTLYPAQEEQLYHGTVHGPKTGAVLPMLAVAAKSVERGIVYTAVTNESG